MSQVATSTRDRLIAATNELFRRRGYHGTSIQAVVEAADATIGSLYHFFPGGKSALAEATLRETGAAYGELFPLFLAEADSVPDAIVAFFDGAADTLVESNFLDPCPIGTVAREVASDDETLRTAAAAVFEQWMSGLQQILSDAGLDDVVAAEFASLIVCAIEGSFVVARTQREPAHLRVAGRRIARMIRDLDPIEERNPAPR